MFSYIISYRFSAHDVLKELHIIWFFLWFPSGIFCRKSKENTRGPPRKKKRDLIKNARVTPRKSAGKYKKSTEIARGIPIILTL